MEDDNFFTFFIIIVHLSVHRIINSNISHLKFVGIEISFLHFAGSLKRAQNGMVSLLFGTQMQYNFDL